MTEFRSVFNTDVTVDNKTVLFIYHSRFHGPVCTYRAHQRSLYIGRVLKLSQNKKGRKNFQLHCFLNTQLPAVKKYSKNDAAGKFFGPSYFDSALVPPQII